MDPPARVPPVLLGIVVAAAAVAPAAASAGAGAVLRLEAGGYSLGTGAGAAPGGSAPAVLDLEARVQEADGAERSGLADVHLEVLRPGGGRSLSFGDVEWVGHVDEAPGEVPEELVVIVSGGTHGSLVLDLTVSSSGLADRPGTVQAHAGWEVEKLVCDGDEYHSHGDCQDPSTEGLEQGAGVGVGVVT